MTTGLAPSTARTYRSSWKAFNVWCAAEQAASLPATPATVERFLRAWVDSGLGRATIVRDVSAIRLEHQRAGVSDPTTDLSVVLTVRASRRKPGVGVATVTRPLTPGELREILARIDRIDRGDLRSIRDAAIILLGWVTAATQADLARLRDGDVVACDEGLRLRIDGRMMTVHRGAHPHTDPVAAMQAWIRASGGVTFRGIGRGDATFGEHMSPGGISNMVARRATAAGLHGVTSRSLRAGAEQVLADAGVPADQLADFMHRSSSLARVERPDAGVEWSAPRLLGL